MTYPIRPLPLGRSCSYRQRWRLARQLPRCGVGRPRRAPHGSHRRWGVLSARPARSDLRLVVLARLECWVSRRPSRQRTRDPRRPQAEPQGRSRHRVPLPTTGGSSLQKHAGQRGALPIPFAWTCGQSVPPRPDRPAHCPGIALPERRDSSQDEGHRGVGRPQWSRRRPGVQPHVLGTCLLGRRPCDAEPPTALEPWAVRRLYAPRRKCEQLPMQSCCIVQLPTTADSMRGLPVSVGTRGGRAECRLTPEKACPSCPEAA